MMGIKHSIRQIFLFCFVILCYLNINGQEIKLTYEHLTNDKISPNGNFITYFKKHKQEDFLVLLDVKKQRVIKMPNLSQDALLSNTFFVGINKSEAIVYLVNLKEFNVTKLYDINEWEQINDNVVLLYSKANSKLTFYNLKNNKETVFNDVRGFSLNKSNQKLLLKYNARDYEIVDFKENLVTRQKYKSDYSLNNVKYIWNDKLGVSYVVGSDNNDVFVLKMSKDEIKKVFQHPLLLDDGKVRVDTTFRDLQFVSDYQIALGLKSNTNKVNKEVAYEIWLGSEGGLTPVKKMNMSYKAQLGILDLNRNELINFFNHKSPFVFKIDSFDNSIYVIDPHKYDDYKEYNPQVDYYKYDSLFNKKFLVKSKLSSNHFFNFSTLPIFLCFKDEKWHVINKKSKVVEEVDNTAAAVFFEKDNMYSCIKEMPVGQRFVLDKHDNISFRDMKDLFSYDYKKNKLKRLTNYSAEGKVGYLDNSNFKELSNTIWSFNFEKVLIDYPDWILTWNTDNYIWSGIDLLTNNNKRIELVKDKAYYTQIKRSKDVITYLKQKANQAPILYRFDLKTKQEYEIYKSNIWDTLSIQTTYEYVEWNDEKYPSSTRGALVCYPKDYDKSKTYPVIVNIYEKKDYNQHHYNSPFVVSGMGFNLHEYSNDGYLIIQPDIKYEVGKTGLSASEYVLSAIEYLSKQIAIDTTNMGLIGHSFGSYETNFIITQTSIFKTAVSSAGVSDLISFYHNLNWDTKRPDSWRLETDQLRMGKPFTEIPIEYLENSPIFHADKIKTPLLIWAGKSDNQVNWHQSVEMFLALKRLNKDVNLILYEGVSHTLNNDEVGKDASRKVKQWFDYYLKGLQAPDWLDEKGLL